jgi:acetylglutamate kinase
MTVLISLHRRQQREVVVVGFVCFIIAFLHERKSFTASAFTVLTPKFVNNNTLRRHKSGHSRIGTPSDLFQSTDAKTISEQISSTQKQQHATTTNNNEKNDDAINGVPRSMDVESALYDLHEDFVAKSYSPLVKDGILPTADPAQVEFVAPDIVFRHDKLSEQAMLAAWTACINSNGNGHYPFAAMMQGSGPYIANHAGKIAVFHIPAEIIENSAYCDALLQDMALCWLLDMKIVIVVAVRYANVPNNDTPILSRQVSHECHNALKVTNQAVLRLVEEEAGFLRTELERKLNRCLRAHHGLGDHTQINQPPEGNIVSGNFYTAHRLGVVRDKNYEYTGYASETHTKNIRQVLDNHDIVLLSTIGLSAMGELVNVNGYHLAATVASSLQASKVIYLASQGSVLRSKNTQTPIQELPVSFAESITSYHQVTCSNMGFATFQNAKEQLDQAAVELLLHMAWSCWAVKNGTSRAHICNPSDGSVLEELFTAKNGANTCIYHDDEIASLVATPVYDDRTTQKDWDDFFASASAQGQTVASFM